MMTNVLLEAGSLTRTPTGLECRLRLPWYRSLPLSVIRIDAVEVNGQPLPETALRFTLNGRTRPVAALDDLTGEYWFVQDSLTLAADAPALPHDAEVAVTLSFWPPYIADFRRKTRGAAMLKVA
ncbi:MAG: DUF6379 domain-containing protein [Rhodobacteraceae bacterium]|jgi:hypothetical protein|nr:DUF6379 domain-containing protein [Paracoccaceae bacterium]